MESELAIMGPKQPFWIQEKLKVQHMQIHTKTAKVPWNRWSVAYFPHKLIHKNQAVLVGVTAYKAGNLDSWASQCVWKWLWSKPTVLWGSFCYMMILAHSLYMMSFVNLI